MRNAVLYTKQPVDKDKCFEIIKGVIPKTESYETQIVIGKPPRSICLWFPSYNIDDIQGEIEKKEMSEGLEHIPYEKPYFTNVDFHNPNKLKKIVALLSAIYPEIIVWVDDDKFYTAQEFAETDFNF